MQVCNQKYFRAGGIVELGHLDKHFVKNKKKRPRTERFCSFFPRYFWNYILTEMMEKFNPMMDKIRAFISKIRTLFSIFIKDRETSLSSLVARLWVWQNMHQYLWICLNILEYAWINCSDYARALNMLLILYVWKAFEDATGSK